MIMAQKNYPYKLLKCTKIHWFIILFLFWIPELKAQEQFQLTNFAYSIHAINPAFSGIEDAINLNLGYRRQWTSVEGAPMTYYAGVNGSLNAFKDANPNKRTLRKSVPRLYGKLRDQRGSINHGAGMYVSGNSFGPFQEISAYLTYSFMLQVSKDYRLAFGLSMEYANQRFNSSKIALYNPDLDEVYQRYARTPSNISRLNFNVGILIHGKNLFAGYSLHQFGSILLSDEHFTETGNQGLYHFIVAGSNILLGPQFSLQPSTLVKYNQSYQWQADLLTKLIYRELLWTGFSWSYNNSIGILFGLRIQNSLYLGYSYEYNTGAISGYSQGTHELVLGYRIFSDRLSTQFLW
jgi:type IX secretion system PorP/SprF family membrane protein